MKVGIVGLGYVGLPLAVAFAEAGQDVVGVSYKPGVGHLRESPALRIIRLLREQGADVSYFDDFIPNLVRL